MKISDKWFKRCNLVICVFPIIYVLIEEHLNPNKYIRFSMFIFLYLFTLILDIGHKLLNRPVKKKDIIGTIIANLVIISMLVYGYIRFVY